MTRILAAALLTCAVLASAGCDNRPPVFVERSTISDTDVEEGPYEVRAIVKDVAGIGSLRILFRPAGGLAGSAEMIPLADPATEDPERPRYKGWIPGHVLGTVIEWGIEACDTFGQCAVDPPLYPLDQYRFRVGMLPSDPRIHGVTPERGPASGGTRVVIDGDDFRPGASVRFGDAVAEHVEWIDTSRVVARSPAHDPGVVDVFVQNPDTLDARAPDAFEFTPAPVLSSVSPPSGPTAGGTPVVLTGQNFDDTTRVYFDGVPCRFLVVGGDVITCETPPGAAGFVDVRAENDDGGFAELPEAFEYIAPPLLDDVQPDRGTDLGGTVIEVVGENFDEGAVVVVGDTPCTFTEWIDEEHLLCTVPPGDPGIVDVTVINEDGQGASMVGGFNYLGPPIIVQVLPPMGPVAGGVEIRIIGAGFSEDMLVTVAGVPATIVDVVDDLELVVLLPPSPVPLFPAPESGLLAVDVGVQNTLPGDMRSDLLEDGFSYIWPPEVFEVIPPSGPTEGGTAVTVVGRFFRQIPPAPIELFFGETLASSIGVLSSTTISAITPPGPPGFVDVTVRNYQNSQGTLPDGFLYIPPPEVIDVEPGRGPTFGGDRVTIIGEFFQDGAIVIFEGVGACTDVVFISSTELECTTPPSPEAGFVDVIVVNPDGQDGEGLQLYEYVPVLVEPDFGLEGGFTRVRVVAAGIQQGVTIRFGNTIATDCQRLSSTEVVCQSPPANLPGPVDVSFTNPNGTGDVAEEGFEYRRYINRTVARSGARLFDSSNHVEAGDLDLDGDTDLVVANGTPGFAQESYLLLNDGSGTFTRSFLPGGFWTANSADLGHINADNLPDIVLGVSELGGAIFYVNQGNGSFSFQTAPVGNFTPGGAFDAVLTNLMGGPRDDLLILTIGCSNDIDVDCQNFFSGADALFEQTGAGAWTDRSGLVPHDLGFVHDHKITDPDLDGDGDRDLVLFVDNGTPEFATAGNEHRVLYNRLDEGLGFVEDRTPFAGLVGDVFGVDSGDIDGDGDPDVLAGNCNPPFGSSEVVYLNNGGVISRSFATLPVETDDCDWAVHLFDADTDGDLDVAFVGDRNSNLQMKLYVNNGVGLFFPSHQSVDGFTQAVAQTRGAELATGDFDGDGDLDVALAATDLPGFIGGGTVELMFLEGEE